MSASTIEKNIGADTRHRVVRKDRQVYRPPPARMHRSPNPSTGHSTIDQPPPPNQQGRSPRKGIENRPRQKRPDLQRYVPKGRRDQDVARSITPLSPSFVNQQRATSPTNSISSVVSEFSGRNRYHPNQYRGGYDNRLCQNGEQDLPNGYSKQTKYRAQYTDRSYNQNGVQEKYNAPIFRNHRDNNRYRGNSNENSDYRGSHYYNNPDHYHSIHSKENVQHFETVPRTKRNRKQNVIADHNQRAHPSKVETNNGFGPVLRESTELWDQQHDASNWKGSTQSVCGTYTPQDKSNKVNKVNDCLDKRKPFGNVAPNYDSQNYTHSGSRQEPPVLSNRIRLNSSKHSDTTNNSPDPHREAATCVDKGLADSMLKYCHITQSTPIANNEKVPCTDNHSAPRRGIDFEDSQNSTDVFEDAMQQLPLSPIDDAVCKKDQRSIVELEESGYYTFSSNLTVDTGSDRENEHSSREPCLPPSVDCSLVKCPDEGGYPATGTDSCTRASDSCDDPKPYFSLNDMPRPSSPSPQQPWSCDGESNIPLQETISCHKVRPPYVPLPVTCKTAKEVVSTPKNPSIRWDDEDTWDTIYDDSGNCTNTLFAREAKARAHLATEVKRVTVGRVKLETPAHAYDVADNVTCGRFPNVVELYDFPTDFTTKDLVVIYKDYIGFHVIWVDDTHALGIFDTPAVAVEVIEQNHPFVKARPLSMAIQASRTKAEFSSETKLLPYKERPVTSAVHVRRLVSGALGMKVNIPSDVREKEKLKLKLARENKKRIAQLKRDAWEGTLENTAGS